MPLLFKDAVAYGTTLGVWKKQESREQLEAVFLLSKNEQKQYHTFKNEARKTEWLTTRILLTEMLEKRVCIQYNDQGRPYINNLALNISISHSKNYVAIIISKFYNPGVDIEQVSDRVSRIKHKFLVSKELLWCHSLNQLTLAWTVKEAIFKTYEKELDFHDILIEEPLINADQGMVHAQVLKTDEKAELILNYRFIEDNLLTYTLVPINK